ncbi:MAG: glycosyltransferase [Eubacteriales bacterium]|nr:glycosyltransferase [Eubacteriales bacterium]
MRILILSGNTGEGHNSAARAMQEYLETRGCEVRILDGLMFLSRPKNEFICKSHVFLYRKLPKVYGMGYRLEEYQSQHQPYQKKLDAKAARLNNRRSLPRRKRGLKIFLEEGRYDAVICVHVFAARLMSELRRSGAIDIPCFFLATDYTCSPGVNQLDMDAWFIPHEKLIPEFESYGIPREKLVPTGIPVCAAFYAHQSRAEARRALKLPEDQPIALLGCGSMGAASMGRKVVALTEALPKGALLVAVCGNNRALERNLRTLIHSPKLQVLGFTDRMSDYMDAADLFITKPGGLSTTEAVNKRIPLLLFNAVPGCETRNLEFLLSIGCAVAESGALSLAHCVREMLEAPERGEALTRRCEAEFSGRAAERIYEALCTRVAAHGAASQK